MNNLYPGYENMIAIEKTQTEVEKHFKQCMEYYHASPEDCGIQYGEAIDGNFHYRIWFENYTGWQVYMLMTGCLASDTKEEAKLEEEIRSQAYAEYEEMGLSRGYAAYIG